MGKKTQMKKTKEKKEPIGRFADPEKMFQIVKKAHPIEVQDNECGTGHEAAKKVKTYKRGPHHGVESHENSEGISENVSRVKINLSPGHTQALKQLRDGGKIKIKIGSSLWHVKKDNETLRFHEPETDIRAKKKVAELSEEIVLEVAPPGREEQVKELKKKFPEKVAYKIAWSQYSGKRK